MQRAKAGLSPNYRAITNDYSKQRLVGDKCFKFQRLVLETGEGRAGGTALAGVVDEPEQAGGAETHELFIAGLPIRPEPGRRVCRSRRWTRPAK